MRASSRACFLRYPSSDPCPEPLVTPTVPRNERSRAGYCGLPRVGVVASPRTVAHQVSLRSWELTVAVTWASPCSIRLSDGSGRLLRVGSSDRADERGALP